VPALIAELGDQAGWRYVEFFTANINNDHTQRAYARACSRFLPGAKSWAVAHHVIIGDRRTTLGREADKSSGSPQGIDDTRTARSVGGFIWRLILRIPQPFRQ
jgi:hypothetical protein